MSQTTPPVLSDISDTIRTNFVGFASFTILVWDHIITFSDEVELIWKPKKGPIIYLFIFNRYFTPLGFVINLFGIQAYLSPTWTVERCTRFVRYEGCTVSIAVEVVGAMMLLRINALYPRQKWISALLGSMLIIETGINAWLISRGEPVLHNRGSGVHGTISFALFDWSLTSISPACSMVFDPAISHAASASAWYPLLYDSIVFALTVNRTLPSIRKKQAGYIIKRLLEDGPVKRYFLDNIRPDVHDCRCPARNQEYLCSNGAAVAMMSRITLSLKKAGRCSERIPAPLFFDRDGRNINPEIFSDTFLQSVTAGDDLVPPRARIHAGALKHPERLIAHDGRSPIQFAIPPSPQPSYMSEPFAFPSAKACSPLRAPGIHDV
ncbi:hypothetical protein K438DRAFT_1754419 [Mycena galopus ATCC 62051]|nr:hypothetical protein K438DRAFT_1754419 [Mycena galopus ATCC 62051]